MDARLILLPSITKGKKPWTYNVSLRCLPAVTVTAEKQEVLHILKECICSFIYPECKVHAPYFHMWPVWLYNIFTPHLVNKYIFEKKFWLYNLCFVFLYKLVWNISHSKKSWARYDKKMYIGLPVKYQLFMSDFNKIWIFSTYFRKIIKYQMPWKSFQWWPSCSIRTDRRKDMSKLTFAFRNFTKAPEKWTSVASVMATSLAVRMSTSIYCCLLVWHQLRGCLWVIYVQGFFIVGQPFITLGNRNVYTKLQ